VSYLKKSIKFLNNHSRYTRFNSKDFNFIWNIKGPYASGDFEI